jgi:hypothetical protein
MATYEVTVSRIETKVYRVIADDEQDAVENWEEGEVVNLAHSPKQIVRVVETHPEMLR